VSLCAPFHTRGPYKLKSTSITFQHSKSQNHKHMDKTWEALFRFQQLPLIYTWRTDIKNGIFNNFRLLNVNLEFPVRGVFVCGVITQHSPLPPYRQVHYMTFTSCKMKFHAWLLIQKLRYVLHRSKPSISVFILKFISIILKIKLLLLLMVL
jgi:hypothetical protein